MADSSQGQADNLEALARRRFGELSEAERRLLLAAPRGEFAVCGPSADHSDPANDPAKADGWGSEREIRAELIRWLCVDRDARSQVDPKGLLILKGKIVHKLDLSFVDVQFPLRLWRCRLTDDADLYSTRIPLLDLGGSCVGSIIADGADIKGDVFLRNGFTAEGEVRLLGAQIRSNLECDGGTFKNPDGKALNGERTRVGGHVFLRNGFTAEGEVSLFGAQIAGSLDCNGGTFKNPPQASLAGSGKALSADGVDVKGAVLLRGGFRAEGEVRLLGAQIGGSLDCNGGTFKNPPQASLAGSGTALHADGVDVKGSVFLRNGFSAEGEVDLLGARIGHNLECDDGTFKNPRRAGLAGSGKALNADGVDIKGAVLLRKAFTAEGEVRLLGAQIGGDLACWGGGTFTKLSAQAAVIKRNLRIDMANAKQATIDLRNASAGALLDGGEASWPDPDPEALGELLLDGFVYGRISGGPTDAPTRLKWLSRQKKFNPQPYRQLAKVLREAGDLLGARHVLFEMEHRQRKVNENNWFSRVWNWMLRWTIGYGQKPERLFLWLWAAGFILTYLGYFSGAMAPTEKEAYSAFEQQGQPPPYYPRFHALVYSFEHSFPFVNLGQKDHWTPNPSGPGRTPSPLPKWLKAVADLGPFGYHALRLDNPSVLRWWLWFQVVAGWVLATLFVAGLTGIVRSE